MASKRQSEEEPGKPAPKVKDVAPEVVSVSRRTDVPAFYLKRYMAALEAGKIAVPNPRNPMQIANVQLTPETLKAIVWWSKSYANYIRDFPDNGGTLADYTQIFNFTINSPNARLEPGLKSSWDERKEQLCWLVDRFGPGSVVVRFDPVVHYRDLRSSDPALERNNLDKFDELCALVGNLDIGSITVALCRYYPKVAARMRRAGLEPVLLTVAQKRDVSADMARRAAQFGVTLRACDTSEMAGDYGENAAITPACCVSSDQIEELVGDGFELSKETRKKDSGQREGCNCCSAKDIGMYSLKCPHGCVMCYGNPVEIPQ